MRPVENDPYDEIPAYNNSTPSYGRQYQPLNPSRGGRGFSHHQAMHRGTGRGTFKYPQQQQVHTAY